jgi:Protein of unknown function (DUF3298)/Deacetylase PdaC
MKPGATLPCLVLAVVAALATGSCRSRRESQAANTSVPQPSATSTPVSTPGENKPTAPFLKGEAYLSGDIEIVAAEIKEQNARFGYELEISYPQIDRPRTPQERQFNSYVRRLVERDVKDFKAFCAQNRKHPDGRKRLADYQMATIYEVLYATEEFLSINLTMESYTGYLNSDWSPVPLNYDLKAGGPVPNLSRLFKPRSNFLKVIASYCVAEFMRRGLNCGSGSFVDEKWLRSGAEPKAENYSSWNLTRDGVQINFGEYQVGPGCLGLVSVVVPYEHLREILRQDFARYRILRPAASPVACPRPFWHRLPPRHRRSVCRVEASRLAPHVVS